MVQIEPVPVTVAVPYPPGFAPMNVVDGVVNVVPLSS